MRERKLPFRFGLETDAGFPRAGMLDFAENKIESSNRARSRSAAPWRTGTGSSFPVRASVCRVPVSDPYEAVLVPDTAVLSDQDKKYLLVLGQGNDVLRRNVILGRLLDDGMRIIIPGKEEDATRRPEDWVITIGLQRARINDDSGTGRRERETGRFPRLDPSAVAGESAFHEPERARTCSPVSSSIGRSSPRCSRW